MGRVGSILGSIAGVLVTLGIIKGIGDASNENDAGAGDIAMAIINGVADLTVKLIPTLLDTVNSLV